ncbi:SRPBCC family protein [Variovorax paradoxus]|jgi:carbon monoxide dehydrogenase subunit G|uniref:CoxG family protein n=1 Tax=Variovorax paradoxus TaxID=34073 RepID=UPI0007DA2FDB
MELQGEQWIPAGRETVWRALDDPEQLARCVPGCEEIRRLGENEMEARLLAKIGPVRAHFSGRIRRLDVVEPQSCRIAFEGSGGAAGMAKGESRVTLATEGNGTRLTYTVEAAVGGKLGQIGGRLVNASARKMADEFFLALNEQLAPKPAAQVLEAAADLPEARRETASAPAALATPVRAAAASAGFGPWSGELQRLLWLAIGSGIGWLASRAF